MKERKHKTRNFSKSVANFVGGGGLRLSSDAQGNTVLFGQLLPSLPEHISSLFLERTAALKGAASAVEKKLQFRPLIADTAYGAANTRVNTVPSCRPE